VSTTGNIPEADPSSCPHSLSSKPLLLNPPLKRSEANCSHFPLLPKYYLQWYYSLCYPASRTCRLNVTDSKPRYWTEVWFSSICCLPTQPSVYCILSLFESSPHPRTFPWDTFMCCSTRSFKNFGWNFLYVSLFFPIHVTGPARSICLYLITVWFRDVCWFGCVV
jgi:hypothetical protein